MVWLFPLKVPLKVYPVPIGVKPFPLFQLMVSVQSILEVNS